MIAAGGRLPGSAGSRRFTTRLRRTWAFPGPAMTGGAPEITPPGMT
jgi:hypothetical protein